ncbi:MAG: hypothetical protein MJ231_07230, partial [bacterium]|nr:hypothetical protein [bacterium]
GTVLIADSKNKTIRDAERRNIYTNNAYVKLLEKEKERRTKFNPENKRFFEENNNKKSCA